MENQINVQPKIAKYWWISVLLGVIAIVLGILLISYPVNSLLTLAIFFAYGFILNGFLEIIYAIKNRKLLNGWGWNLASGIIDLFLGIILLLTPSMTILLMIYFVGFWILFRSIWMIGMAIELQKSGVKNWGWLLLIAILGVLFSFTFTLSPYWGGTFIVIYASISIFIYGCFRIALGFYLRTSNTNKDQ